MSTLPVYVPLVFGSAVVLALYLFYRASGYSRIFMILACIWIGLHPGFLVPIVFFAHLGSLRQLARR
jgi:hypothetical protein